MPNGQSRGPFYDVIPFASCFLAIGLALEAQGLAVAFVLGVLAAVATTVLEAHPSNRY